MQAPVSRDDLPEATPVDPLPHTRPAQHGARTRGAGAVDAAGRLLARAAMGAGYGMLVGIPTGLVLGAISGVLYLLLPLFLPMIGPLLSSPPRINWPEVVGVLWLLLIAGLFGAAWGAGIGCLMGGAVGALTALARDEIVGAIGGTLLGAALGPLLMRSDPRIILLAVFAGGIGGLVVAVVVGRLTTIRPDA